METNVPSTVPSSVPSSSVSPSDVPTSSMSPSVSAIPSSVPSTSIVPSSSSVPSTNNAQEATYDGNLGAPKCPLAASCHSGSLLDGRGSMGNGEEPNKPNSLDACTDGNLGLFHVDESCDHIQVSRASGGNSYLTEGEEVTITATIWCWGTGTSDYIDFYYASDASNPVWTQTGQRQQCPGGGAQIVTQSYTLPQGSIQQAVRVNVMYLSKDATDGCVAGNYNDVDDLVITVVQSSSSLPSSVPSASPSDLPSFVPSSVPSKEPVKLEDWVAQCAVLQKQKPKKNSVADLKEKDVAAGLEGCVVVCYDHAFENGAQVKNILEQKVPKSFAVSCTEIAAKKFKEVSKKCGTAKSNSCKKGKDCNSDDKSKANQCKKEYDDCKKCARATNSAISSLKEVGSEFDKW
eukprot:scaffold8071_cov171-Skeletonema_menzelii.AAC.1